MDHGVPDRPRPAGTPEPSSAGGRLVTRRNALLLGVAGVVAVPVVSALRTPAPSPSGAPAAPSPSSTPPAASASPAPGGALDPRDFGAVGDGRADDTRALQDLVDASTAQGAVAVVPAGTYRCTAGLLLTTGARLQLARGAHLLKDWAAETGLVNAFLRNRDLAVKADGVQITGPGTIGARDHSSTGVVLALYGDDVQLREFTIDTYAGGQAVMFAGDRGRMDGVTIRNSAVSTGTGGIRVVGGADFLATGCHVESGDDCLQFVPIGNPDAVLYDMDITGGSFVGCTGTSTTSRFMVALLEFTGGEPGTTDMSASVVDCSFRDCRGAGTNRGIVVKNTHSQGRIAGVSFTDCSVDMSGAADAETQEIRIQTDPASRGSISGITFTRTDVTRPVNSTVRIGGPGISAVTFDGCVFTAPSGASPLTLVADQVDQLVVRGCTFTGAAGKRQLVAGPGQGVTALSVEDSRFTDVPDGVWAVDLLGAPGARVAGSTFQAAPGATDARAIRVSPASTGVVIEHNDVTGIGHPAPITDRADGTTIRGNRGA
ncbi:glycosyl hydrolase family 28-related protein [Geodermatophilus sp. CPCC 205506]|uniref:glycosyl hydrolase family 28-related protein n=1 Tax=Geodermatophilus sp. CPCC 205506 TaxID=2936596 RepID=UPI003EED9345